MRLRKTLAFAAGEAESPKKIRTLAYALTLSLPLLAACGAHAAAARGASAAPAQVQAQPRTEPQTGASASAQGNASSGRTGPACGSGIEAVLRQGEAVREAVCRFGRDYIMTDSSLLIVTRAHERFSFEPISLAMHSNRTDMSQFQGQGIVDWEPGEDSVFILTRDDRMLTRIPNEGMEDTVPAYSMPFDTSALRRDSMVYRSGVLFIAPRHDNVIAMSFQGGLQSRSLPLRSELDDAGFFMRGNALFFGKEGAEETEIRFEGMAGGNGIDRIRLIGRK